MKTYTYSEARQRLASLLDQAGREGEVQIRRQDGSTFVLRPLVSTRSPLDVPSVPSTFRRGELVEMIRQERETPRIRMVKERTVKPAKAITKRRKRPRSG